MGKNKYNHWMGKLFGFFNGNSRWAVTFGQTTFYSVEKKEVGLAWKVHEDQHKLQYKRDGWIKFLSKYCWQGVTKGYYKIDYEIEATQAAALGRNIYV